MARALKSLARTSEDLKKDRSYGTIMPMDDTPNQPVFPYGCCISLCSEDLAKIDMDADCDAGDEIVFVARAVVKDCNSHMDPSTGEKTGRVELQLVAMRILDSTDDGDMDADDRRSSRYKDAAA